MSHSAILALGAIAGMTIFIGLPMGRVRNPAPGLRAMLNAIAIGILIFLLWDVLSHSTEPVEAALVAASVDHTGTWARFAGLASTFVACLGAGMLSLVYYDRWNGRRHRRRLGPGAAHIDELTRPAVVKATATDASRLALFIALGIVLVRG